jgi:aspartyl/asparaginyl-tRNA synthetase
MTIDDMKVKTGTLGEKLVAKYFRDIGHKVDESLDLYDRIKDMTIDDELCEVKTQQRWHSENAFSIGHNQLNKCKSVDRLIIVETPSKYKSKVTLYEYPKDRRRFYKKETSDGRYMYLIKVSEGIELTSFTDPVIIKQFNNYSASSYKPKG